MRFDPRADKGCYCKHAGGGGWVVSTIRGGAGGREGGGRSRSSAGLDDQKVHASYSRRIVTSLFLLQQLIRIKVNIE